MTVFILMVINDWDGCDCTISEALEGGRSSYILWMMVGPHSSCYVKGSTAMALEVTAPRNGIVCGFLHMLINLNLN